MPDNPADNEFCPGHDDIFLALMSLLPRGRAWQTVDLVSLARDTLLKRVVSGLALGWTKIEDAACNTLNEWFCYSAAETIQAWNTDYGIPDECDLYNANVCAKVEAQHSVSAASLLALLEANGYSAVGRWLKGSDLEFPGVRSTFHVEVDPGLSTAFTSRTVLPFRLGEGRKIGEPDLSRIVCMLERYVPLHCAVEVSLSSGSGDDTAMMVVGM